MRGYLGHFVDRPSDQFLALADDFQGALDAADMLAQPDESSVRPIKDRFLLRIGLMALGGSLFLSNAPRDPVLVVNEDLTYLRQNPGTGPTGDTTRSYGPICPDCRHRHFPDEECKVFLEPEDDHTITLLADPKNPTQAILEVHRDSHLVAPTLQPRLKEVCDLDDYDFMAVFPFLLRKGTYVKDEDEACAEGDHNALYEAFVDAGIHVPNQDRE